MSKPTLHVATAVGSTTTPPNDKLLITIRHPPTDKENKFKVKATHTVGRVLSSACLAFGLNASGYVTLPTQLLWVLLPSFGRLTCALSPML